MIAQRTQGLSNQSRVAANRARIQEEARMQRMRLEAQRSTPNSVLRQQIYKFSPLDVGMGTGGDPQLALGLDGGGSLSMGGGSIDQMGLGVVPGPSAVQQQQPQLGGGKSSFAKQFGHDARMSRQGATGVAMSMESMGVEHQEHMQQAGLLLRNQQQQPGHVQGEKAAAPQTQQQQQLLVAQQQQMLRQKLAGGNVDPDQEKMLKDLFPGWFVG